MNPLSYTYQSQWAFFLLLLLPVLIAFYIGYLRKKHPFITTSGDEGLEKIKGGLLKYLRHLPFVLKMAACVFLITALARPQKKLDDDTITENTLEGIDIVIALDISQSMKAMDFSPNRLEASKQVAQNFIKKRPTDRIGLVVYEGESYTACALTTDHESLLRRFKQIQSGLIEGGTAIGMGLSTAVNRLRDSEAKSKVIILLTDGENTSGKVDPVTAAGYAKNFGIRVYTIGVGTKGKAKFPVGKNRYGQMRYDYIQGKIDEGMLTKIAKQTGGKYYRAKNKKQLGKIYTEIDKLEKAKIKTAIYKRDIPEAFHLFAFIGLCLMLSAFLIKHFIIKSVF